MANQFYHGLNTQLRAHYLNTGTKFKLYKTLSRHVLIYGSKIWALTKCDETKLKSCEKKTQRKHYGPINRIAHGELDITMKCANYKMDPT
jgi:hypothetical protein